MNKTFEVRCDKCSGKSITDINETVNLITWRKVEQVISGRFRLDGQWGWQCSCGNNSLMTKQEKNNIKDWTTPEPKELEAITNSLVVEKNTGFSMQVVD